MASGEEKDYKAGDDVQVWSETGRRWSVGKVRAIDTDEKVVTVEYEKDGGETPGGSSKLVKALPFDSEHLKSAFGMEKEAIPEEKPKAKEAAGGGKAKAADKATTDKAQAEAPKTAAAAPPPLEKRTEKDFANLCLGAFVLCGFSGMVNAVAILDMANTVSHHTGNASHFGRMLGRDGFRFVTLMVAYVAGAGGASFADCDGDAVFAGRKSEGLLAVAGTVAAGSLLKGLFGAKTLALLLWALSQGLQNGITSRMSGMALRTTHMTGSLTDAGLVLGQLAKAHYKGGDKPNLRKPILLLGCVLSFAAGGFFVSFLWSLLGALGALAPAAGLAALASGQMPLSKLMQLLDKATAMAKDKLEEAKKKAK